MSRPKGLPKTGGRQKGAPNKITTDLRAAIMGAFDKVGGMDYLARVATDQPNVFVPLLGKILPTALTGADGEGPVEYILKWREPSKSTSDTNPAQSSSHGINGANGGAPPSPIDVQGKH